jgi:hypothetical protein
MQHIPDKEFDQLFKDKFNDAEIEPSANLWANIEKELEPKRKRIIPIYWMAAASVTVVITALLMLQQKETLYLRGNSPIAINPPKPVDNAVINDDTALKQLAKTANKQPLVNANINLNGKKVGVGVAGNLKDTVSLQPNTQIARLPLKQTNLKPLEALDVAPINTNGVQTENATANKDNYSEESYIEEIATITQRKGIRNVGDLVNFVVDKVDKREKKFIKFNTDDDESTVSAINIGFFKLNKRSRAER